MTGDRSRWVRQGEAFWRAHHEAWKRSDLNQREYCEAQDIPLKSFGNWRAVFKAEPEFAGKRLLCRRGGLSPSSGPSSAPVVPPARPGHRRRILAEADMPGAKVSEIARRYGIVRRVICRWRQELPAAVPAFVDVKIVDARTDQEEVTP